MVGACHKLLLTFIDIFASEKLIQGFAKEKVIYNGPDFPLEMIVFSGIDSAQIDSFLADYKQTGAQTVPLKAIITPQNIFWTVEALFKELWKEHLHFLPE